MLFSLRAWWQRRQATKTAWTTGYKSESADRCPYTEGELVASWVRGRLYAWPPRSGRVELTATTTGTAAATTSPTSSGAVAGNAWSEGYHSKRTDACPYPSDAKRASAWASGQRTRGEQAGYDRLMGEC